MSLCQRELAIWLGVQPNYWELAQERPKDLWVLMSAPYNGARYWLNDLERRD